MPVVGHLGMDSSRNLNEIVEGIGKTKERAVELYKQMKKN